MLSSDTSVINTDISPKSKRPIFWIILMVGATLLICIWLGKLIFRPHPEAYVATREPYTVCQITGSKAHTGYVLRNHGSDGYGTTSIFSEKGQLLNVVSSCGGVPKDDLACKSSKANRIATEYCVPITENAFFKYVPYANDQLHTYLETGELQTLQP